MMLSKRALKLAHKIITNTQAKDWQKHKRDLYRILLDALTQAYQEGFETGTPRVENEFLDDVDEFMC